jgi:hypothetical protein
MAVCRQAWANKPSPKKRGMAGRLWQARKSRKLGRNRNRKFASLSEERATNTVWSDGCDYMGAEEEC